MSSDLEYACNDLGLAHFGSNEMCFFCGANKSDKSFSDVHDGAAWRDSIYTNAQILNCIRRLLHPLAAHPISLCSLFALTCSICLTTMGSLRISWLTSCGLA